MDSLDLCHFGWDGCTIPTDLKDICSHLPTWKNLKTLRNPLITTKKELHFPWKFIKNADGENCMPCYYLGSAIDDGGYANIYKAQRAIYKPASDNITGTVKLVKSEPFQEICIKEIKLIITPEEEACSDKTEREKIYENEIMAILYEAFIHAILQKTLERENHSSAVPNLFEIVGTTQTGELPNCPTDFNSIWIGMEFLNGNTLERFLENNLIAVANTTSPSIAQQVSILHNEALIIDTLIQLAFFLNLLQDKLRFNHRDLKLNNLFVRHHPAGDGWLRKLGDWTCQNDIVIIDFGFSCIACGKGFIRPRATLVGAGSWYSSEDDCMKYGRDLGQFLYSLHCAFPLQLYVSPQLFDILHRALVAEVDGLCVDMMMGLQEDGRPKSGTKLPARTDYNYGIYIFLKNKSLEIPGCNPMTFMTELNKYRTLRESV